MTEHGAARQLEDAPVYVISVVARMTGLHAQTLRQYDRIGLVSPQRTGGGGRRYSVRDVERLRVVQQLSAEGVGLAGIKQILEMQNHIDALTDHIAALEETLDEVRRESQRQLERVRAGSSLLPAPRSYSTAVVVHRSSFPTYPPRRGR